MMIKPLYNKTSRIYTMINELYMVLGSEILVGIQALIDSNPSVCQSTLLVQAAMLVS